MTVPQCGAGFKILTFMLLCSSLLITSACSRGSQSHEAREFSTFRDPGLEGTIRVVTMPLYRSRDIGSSAATIDHNLTRSLTELNRFEMVSMDASERDNYFSSDPLRSNRVEHDALRRLREDFGSDAVLIGRIGHWQSFDPVAIGVTLYLIDCRDGSVLWSATGMWDAALRSTQDDIREWYQAQRGQGNEVLGGWRTVLNSPSTFTRYVSDRLAASVPYHQDDPR
ncbi:MAG: hypothetical protein EA401_05800 [Planctomycetota bacterium]|nr:MAG: hypothetical protein EA401_05800 [Planctomycetota bacterium]